SPMPSPGSTAMRRTREAGAPPPAAPFEDLAAGDFGAAAGFFAVAGGVLWPFVALFAMAASDGSARKVRRARATANRYRDWSGTVARYRAARSAPRANIPFRYAVMRPVNAEAATVEGEAR